MSETVELIVTECTTLGLTELETVELGTQGPPGPPGSPGAATISVTAGETLSGHRAVRISGGLAYYADCDTQEHAGTAIGVTVGAALNGSIATIQTLGALTELSWNWTPAPVFVGTTGQLTQTPQTPTGTYVHQIGVATSPTEILINPQLAIGTP